MRECCPTKSYIIIKSTFFKGLQANLSKIEGINIQYSTFENDGKEILLTGILTNRSCSSENLSGFVNLENNIISNITAEAGQAYALKDQKHGILQVNVYP